MSFFCIHCRSEIDPKYKACPYCGEAITDFLRRYLQSPIDGKYQIIARLGVGGMGEVYKVLHTHLNSVRVIKLMRSNIATDPGAHERFLREARLATRIQHPNVAALYDFSTLEDQSHYMVWEYIEGINLHELIHQRGPLSPRYAARLSIQALLGLDAIHRQGIIHRDISPENLMITRDDEGNERVKIIDLGIAKSGADEGDNRTKTGMFVGKWKYCSPEHLGMLSEGEKIDGRADIYSFGITLYEMLTGVPPFQADTPHGYLLMHASEKPKILSAIDPTVAACPELEDVIFRSLEKDRKNRFATARDFAHALEAILPNLDDSSGATAIPVAAEATEEPTRLASAGKVDAATVAQDAATVMTRSDSKLAETVAINPLEGEPTVHTVERPSFPSQTPQHSAKRFPMGMSIAAAVAVIVIIAGGMMLRDRKPVSVETPKPVQAAMVPSAAGHLGINAYPWGEVTSIKNVDSGEPIEMKAPLMTPAPVALPPGNYEVTVSNPSFKKPVSRTVTIRAGEEAQLNVPFIDPERAALPRFGGSR